MVYLTAWGMVERAYHADVGLGCDNMIYKFDSVCDVVKYNLYELFWEWQIQISHHSYNPHGMYIITEKFAKSVYEYTCIASDVFRLVELSDDWYDLTCQADRMFKIMCDWLRQAKYNAFDSLNRDVDFLGGY